MALEMDVPLELSTRGLSSREAQLARHLVRKHAEKLGHVSRDIIMCRVAVEKPQKYQDNGNPYRVRVRVTAPGHTEVIVTKEPGQRAMHDPLAMVIKDAFRAARRSLESEIERRRRHEKRHEPGQVVDDDVQPSIGFVVRVMHDRGYGFLKTADGRELYFHRNSVLHGGFDDLRPGTQVRFEAEQGEDGPQATSVTVMSQHGGHRTGGPNLEDPQGWVRDET